MKGKFLSIVSLFASTSTLFCCAIPALISLFAGGAAVSSFLSIFPWIVPLSHHKVWIFIVAAIMLTISGLSLSRNKKSKACDSKSGEQGCEVSGKFRLVSFRISLGIYICAIFFSYLYAPIRIWLDGLGGGS